MTPEMEALRAKEQARLVAMVRAFVKNKMHEPWQRELLKAMEAQPICHCGAFTRAECDEASARDDAFFDSMGKVQP